MLDVKSGFCIFYPENTKQNGSTGNVILLSKIPLKVSLKCSVKSRKMPNVKHKITRTCLHKTKSLLILHSKTISMTVNIKTYRKSTHTLFYNKTWLAVPFYWSNYSLAILMSNDVTDYVDYIRGWKRKTAKVCSLIQHSSKWFRKRYKISCFSWS